MTFLRWAVPHPVSRSVLHARGAAGSEVLTPYVVREGRGCSCAPLSDSINHSGEWSFSYQHGSSARVCSIIYSFTPRLFTSNSFVHRLTQRYHWARRHYFLMPLPSQLIFGILRCYNTISFRHPNVVIHRDLCQQAYEVHLVTLSIY